MSAADVLPPASEAPATPPPGPKSKAGDKAASSAILLREASRSSRQWRTYAGRTAFSGLLMATLLLATWIGTQTASSFDPSNLQLLGRSLFLGFAVAEIVIAMVAAPAVVARGVIEEREEKTLDLVVLSRLTPRQILSAKMGSRLLTMVMVVVGALPILSLVTSLGGVSVVEVVAVTLDAVAAILVLGFLGGFFALFTRSQVVSAIVAVLWTIGPFLVLPWIYALATLDAYGETQLSPLYGPAARGWVALLAPIAYLPTLYRLWSLSARMFELRVSNASFGRLFAREEWSTSWWIGEGVALAAGLVLVMPACVACWVANGASYAGTQSWLVTGGIVVAEGIVWLWTSFFVSWCTWVYLRVGAEWVIAIDTLLGSSGAARKAGGDRPPMIGINPILWREARPKALSAWAVALVLWLIALWAAFQSMLWLIPGGLLTLGVINAALAWFGVAWLATSSIERERREGTLEILLVSTMRSPWIVLGKAAGAALPTLPFLVVSLPLLVVGIPHVNLLVDNGNDMGESVLHGIMVAGWAGAMWLFLLAFSMATSLRVGRARSAYAWNIGLPVAMLTVPWMVGLALAEITPIKVLMRAILPVGGVHAPWWEPVFSTTALSGAAVVLFAATCIRLRAWTARVMG